MRLALRLVVALAALVPPGWSQRAWVPLAQAETFRVTAEGIEELRAAVEAQDELGAETREALLARCAEAAADLEEAERARERAEEFRRSAAEAPGMLETLRRELAEPPEPPSPDLPSDAGSAELRSALEAAEAELDVARQRLAELERELGQRSERRASLPPALAEWKRELGELALRIVSSAIADIGGTSSLGQRVHRAALSARAEELRASIAAAQAELASYDAREALLPVRIDRAQRQLRESEELVALLRDRADAARRAEAERSRREAEELDRAAGESHPVLEDVSSENREYTERRSGEDGLAGELERVRNAIEATTRRLEELERSALDTRRKIEVLGRSNVAGLLLRRQLEAVPDARAVERELRRHRARLAEVQYEIYVLEDRRRELGDVQHALTEVVSRMEPGATGERAEELRAAALPIVRARHESLEALLADHKLLFERLDRLVETSARLVAAASEYREYIGEHILWVRSVEVPWIAVPGELVDAAAWLFDPAAWRLAVAANGREALRSPRAWIPLALLVAALLAARRPARRALRELSGPVSRAATDSFLYTLRAFLATAVIAGLLPATLLLIGELLALAPDAPDQAAAIAVALPRVAALVLSLAVLRATLSSRGLAEAHFRWPGKSIVAMRRHLSWYAPLVAVAMLSVLAFDASARQPFVDSFGRCSLIVGALATGLFFQRALDPEGDVMSFVLRRNPTGILARSRLLWLGAAVLLPVAVALAAVAGYQYTAARVARGFVESAWLVLALTLAHATLLRGLNVARRRLAVERAVQAREAARAVQEAGDAPGADARAAVEAAEVDLPELDERTRALFRLGVACAVAVGFVLIWLDVLPALRVLHRVQVWPELEILAEPEEDWPAGVTAAGAIAAVTEPVTEPAAEPDGEAPADPAGPSALGPAGPSGRSPRIPFEPADGSGLGIPAGSVTLGALGLALLIVLVTVLAVRNVPGMLELFVLQRLPIDQGGRYAIASVASYLIVIVGITSAFGAIGIGWRNVQWLAAALTFGLAFGLQEIFANFVSGLILLIERPMRVGDVVVVGTTEGRVSRIRMRATTITDWDRRELVVPNREFITGQFVNLSLSDAINRVTVRVGIAYGSDTKKATELLFQAARATDHVLEDPPPRVVFFQFGESSLDFKLYLYIPSRDFLFDVVDEAHRRIDALFRDAKVEIAFPQRDIHVRTMVQRAAERARAEGGTEETPSRRRR